MNAKMMIKRAGWRRLSILIAAAFASAGSALAAAAPKIGNATLPALSSDGGRIVIEGIGAPSPAPLFFSANAEHILRLGATEIAGEVKLKLHVVQGRPEVLTLGLSGDGEIVEVGGTGLRDWAVRQGNGPTSGKRFLDLHPTLSPGAPEPRDLELTVRTRLKKPTVPGTVTLLLVNPGEAVGFASRVTVEIDASVDAQVTAASGLTPLGEPAATGSRVPLKFHSTAEGKLEMKLTARGAARAGMDLINAELTGRVNEPVRSVAFRLTGQLRVQKAGARLRLLSGHAALNDKTAGDGWHVELVAPDGGSAYEIVGDREGVLPVELGFAAALQEEGDWRGVDFQMPAGAVVPLRLEGLGDDLEFHPQIQVVPTASAQGWLGFLPADGRAEVAWKHTRKAAEGTLAFTSFEQSEVRVGAGLLRQTSQISFRVLQGKLTGVRLRIEGPGEILGVEGSHVVGWKVLPGPDARSLEVALSRPFEGEGSLVVRSQAALDSFPTRAEPLRLTPEGAVRHSGFVRVASSGAVRLEVANTAGMLQLAPAQFPGPAVEGGARQVFVYRFPSASRGYGIVAGQIQPEVGVSQVVTYELTETDRVIDADLELDVREASLRDWSLKIPADYAVVSVNGSDVAEHAVESDAKDGYRTLKILFGRAVDGRQLLKLRLEKNQAAAAGDWRLPALVFPGAKSVRGQIGVASTAGYRVAPVTTERLAEVPLSFFPRQMPGLQQAWRLREVEWTAALHIEALGQSVQADVFHLYSLKEGVVYGSVLFNYFVVGAPANEWRVEVPESAGNIDVVGQNVRRDWRREGNQVIVALHQPVLGAATLLITFEQPMSARGGTIRPGELRPLGVQGERGFVQVVSPLQVKYQIRTVQGLLKLEPMELPAEFRLLSSSPSLAVYQYTTRPFTLEMGVEWHQPAETVEQVVDFAKLASQVSRDGQVVTEARYFVKTRGQKALRLALPAGVKLWEARVDHEVVTARTDANQTLVPLPARLNPNEPVEVNLRLGQTAGSGSTINLAAPTVAGPVVISEWTLRGDPERLLVPRGGNAELVQPALTESGFEWISTHSRGMAGTLLAIIALAALLLRGPSRGRIALGIVACLGAAGMAVMLAFDARSTQRANLTELTFAATLLPASEAVAIQVANVAPWRAVISWWGIAAAAVGSALLIAGWLRSSRVAIAAGATLAAGGVLVQHIGAAPFFLIVTGVLFLLMLLPGIARWLRGREEESAGPGPGASVVASLLLIAGLIGWGNPSAARAGETTVAAGLIAGGAKAAQSTVQTWTIRENRLFAELDFTARGSVGDSFLLLNHPAVLTDFKGDGLRVSKVERDGQIAYFAVAEREGALAARAKFEMAAPELGRNWTLATGPAAMQRVTIDLDQPGWEFGSPAAVLVLPASGLPENHSGATLVLAPDGTPVVRLQPRQRDLATEAKQFFAETSVLYLPGPGVVNGFARVTVRPAQGRLNELEIDVPAGFTVGEVARGPVGTWRFDPEKRRLHLAVEPAQTATFMFDVEMQRGTGALPLELALEPPRILGAAGEVGMLALAFGSDAQPENIRPAGLSPVNAGDFDANLLPRGADGKIPAVVQQAWRYGRDGGRVELKVAPVEPEVRVASRQLLTLDDDRLVDVVNLDVAIMRVGLFRLSFALPPGLEVEALSGTALNHWTEATEAPAPAAGQAPQRIVTLHLNGRTIGEQKFNLTLAGAAPRAQADWPVPKFLLREATRQTGELLLVPGKGIRLRAVDRQNATQLDPRAAGGMQPGTLAFRLLQEDWALRVGIETLEPWVTAQALQDVTMREGQTLTRIGLRYRIENAAVKQLRLRLPGLSEEQIRTVHATGSAVSDFVKIAGEADVWEVHFQRGIAGETDVQIEFQGVAAREQNREMVATPVFTGARQTTLFVALRGGGRLELDAGDLPRGWQRTDWSTVPANLQGQSDRSVPALCFRVAEPERPLVVTVRRHDAAEALKLHVTSGELATLFSPDGAALTTVALKLEVAEKSTLRVRLPEGSRLFNTFVNAESVSAAREGDAYLFYVSPNTGADRSAAVRLAYSVPPPSAARIELLGPSLSVPLENVSWRIVIPPGYRLAGYRGGLQLREDRAAGSFSIADYQSLVSTLRAAESKKATALFEEANWLMQRGEQQQAGEVLARASKNTALDQASNEDARVQLRALKTQQAVLGLNTRRQRLYLDNRGDTVRNEQLEQAANLNPFMQGKINFNPQQADQLLMGNTVEENTALRGIAARLVDQQLAAEPAPGAIDVTVPERGQVLTFTRSLQVDGAAALGLTLQIGPTRGTSVGFMLVLLGGIALIVAFFPRKPVRN